MHVCAPAAATHDACWAGLARDATAVTSGSTFAKIASKFNAYRKSYTIFAENPAQSSNERSGGQVCTSCDEFCQRRLATVLANMLCSLALIAH